MIKKIIVIARKELLGIFRDKTTLILMLLPVFLFPVLRIGLQYINNDSSVKLNVAIINGNFEGYSCFLEFVSNTEDNNINVVETDNPFESLEKNEVDCIISIQNYEFDFLYNSSYYKSLSSATKIGSLFEKYYYSVLKQSQPSIFSFNLKDENYSVASNVSAMTNIVVPIILILLITKSTSSYANDIFAGEKERKTLEMLFLSGCNRKCIYFGKTISLLCLGGLNVVISLSSYFITYLISSKSIFQQFKFFNVGNAFSNISVIIVYLLLLSFIFTIIPILTSMISKSAKNSQLLNEIILAFPTLLSVSISFGLFELKSEYKYVPIMNLIFDINSILSGRVFTSNFVITIISNVVLIIVIVVFSIKYIDDEKILL